MPNNGKAVRMLRDGAPRGYGRMEKRRFSIGRSAARVLTASLVLVVLLAPGAAHAQVGGIIEDSGDKAGGIVGDVADSVGDAVDDAADTVEDTIKDTGDEIDDAVDGPIGDAVDDVTDSVGDSIGDAGGSVGDTVKDTGGKADDTITDTTGEAGETIDGVTGGGNDDEDGNDTEGPDTGGSDDGSGGVPTDVASGGPNDPRSDRQSGGAATAERNDTDSPGGNEPLSRRIQRSGVVAGIAGQVLDSVKRFAFPLLLVLLVAGFLALQNYFDRRDPKLAAALIDPGDDYLSFT